MGLIVMTTLCVLLLALLTPSASLPIRAQSPYENANEVQRDSLPALPRKIRLFEDKGYRSQDHFQTYNGQKEYVAGKSYDKDEQVMVHGHGRQGTRQEWVDQGAETSPFYTMDYTHVRRRRHIHNKSMPVAP
ncbi:hypothetical protein I3760_06G095600 [Carya illinoinensis]|uniref:Uncharacterized protein n=1 Tax=Carya illinoinensis TaxID=32201 RepID=A0A8T1QA01_CARIL|nr:uncharacterized protein LOC122314337 [Carya illinoinensis]KAG2702560.1 hypothetical protein I3760_06G095600 [Carya illinoinensis]KAG6651217.1 hypothetical protein CIPAW_06G095100 [Carya illinoinensis]